MEVQLSTSLIIVKLPIYVFFWGLELENHAREKLWISKFFLPALFFFIIAEDALLKFS